jgi:hypothetical protein
MTFDRIDWNTSIEQQVDKIVVAILSARNLVQQIRDKSDARPDLIIKENYYYFQSVIRSMNSLSQDIKTNPLYKPALLQLLRRQKRKQQRTIARYFGSLVQLRTGGNLDS